MSRYLDHSTNGMAIFTYRMRGMVNLVNGMGEDF